MPRHNRPLPRHPFSFPPVFRSSLAGLLLAVAVSRVVAGERALIDTAHSAHAKLYMPDLGDVRWNGGLLGERFEVCRTTMVPHLWEIFSDDTESHAWAN